MRQGKHARSPRTKDKRQQEKMKSQDIVLLFRLVSLSLAEARLAAGVADAARRSPNLPFDWEGWEPEADEPGYLLAHDLTGAIIAERYTVRALSSATGISKTEVSASLARSRDAGLARIDASTGRPSANRSALLEIAEHCARYVFPVRPGGLARGIPTGFSAPVLMEAISSAGETGLVWPYARGNATGQGVTPLHKAVPVAVRQDPDLYAMLALVDALRLGGPRERGLARDRLASLLGQ